MDEHEPKQKWQRCRNHIVKVISIILGIITISVVVAAIMSVYGWVSLLVSPFCEKLFLKSPFGVQIVLLILNAAIGWTVWGYCLGVVFFVAHAIERFNLKKKGLPKSG